MLSYFLFCLFHLAFSLLFTMIVSKYFYSILILFSYFLFSFSSYLAFLPILYYLLFRDLPFPREKDISENGIALPGTGCPNLRQWFFESDAGFSEKECRHFVLPLFSGERTSLLSLPPYNSAGRRILLHFLPEKVL